jgi:hypothetical protein
MTLKNISSESQPTEKRKPLSEYFDYICDFHHIDMNLKTNYARQKYHDDWMRKYQIAIADWVSYDITIWATRLRQSLKLCFSATYFALESRKAQSNRSMASAYYLGYYSALHAMWAVIYLDPQQSTKNVYSITHSKILNLFHSTYAHGNNSPLQVNTKKFIENLRFLREYYSYRMPLNSPFQGDAELKNALTSLGGFVKQCIQLSHLQSHLIMKSAYKKRKSSASLPYNSRQQFIQEFSLINGKERESNKTIILDPSDKSALHEAINQGCDIMAHSISYDHMFDEYMTYDDDHTPIGAIVAEARTLVGAALYGRP